MFSDKVSAALKKEKKGGEERKQGLKVDPVSPHSMSTWFERSLSAAGLLRNGQRERNKIQIWTRNTCSSDSIFQAIVWLYIDDEQFRQRIDEHIRTSQVADLARSISSLARGTDFEHLFRSRRELLSKGCYVSSKGNVKEYQCVSSTYESIEDLELPALFPAVISTSNCKCRIKRTFVTLPFDYKDLITKPLSKLPDVIDARFSDEKITCKRCGQKHRAEYIFGDIVFVVIAQYIVDLREVSSQVELPPTINLRGQKYKLICFTAHSRGHGTIYCRRKKDKWYHYNDNKNIATLFEFEHSITTDNLMYKRIT